MSPVDCTRRRVKLIRTSVISRVRFDNRRLNKNPRSQKQHQEPQQKQDNCIRCLGHLFYTSVCFTMGEDPTNPTESKTYHLEQVVDGIAFCLRRYGSSNEWKKNLEDIRKRLNPHFRALGYVNTSRIDRRWVACMTLSALQVQLGRAAVWPS